MPGPEAAEPAREAGDAAGPRFEARRLRLEEIEARIAPNAIWGD